MRFFGGRGKQHLQNGKKNIFFHDRILVLGLKKQVQFAWAKCMYTELYGIRNRL